MDIECADGQQLPYIGYTEIQFQLPGHTHLYDCILLVTQNSRYNSEVPLLLGTNTLSNIIETLKNEHGERFLQISNLTTPWYLSFRCILLRERELQKNNNRIGLIRTDGTKSITITPNTSITVNGYVDKEIPYQNTPAIVQSTTLAKDSDYDIEPSLIQYHHKQNGPVTVRISNVTTKTINIPPKAIICELQPVSVQAGSEQPNEKEISDIMSLIEVTKSDLNDQEFEQGLQLIKSYIDIFSRSDDDVGHTDIVQDRIDLIDEKPFKQRYRHIPQAAYDDVRAHLRQLLNAGIIQPSHSPWASNVVLVRKKDKTLTLCRLPTTEQHHQER